MKTSLTAIALSLTTAFALAGGMSSAAAAEQSAVRFVSQGDGLVPDYTTHTSSKTRAEVIAELQASQERMDYVHVGDEVVPLMVFASMRSREEVRAEAEKAAVARAMSLLRPEGTR